LSRYRAAITATAAEQLDRTHFHYSAVKLQLSGTGHRIFPKSLRWPTKLRKRDALLKKAMAN
jgi:hypothetical protein